MVPGQDAPVTVGLFSHCYGGKTSLVINASGDSEKQVETVSDRVPEQTETPPAISAGGSAGLPTSLFEHDYYLGDDDGNAWKFMDIGPEPRLEDNDKSGPYTCQKRGRGELCEVITDSRGRVFELCDDSSWCSYAGKYWNP